MELLRGPVEPGRTGVNSLGLMERNRIGIQEGPVLLKRVLLGRRRHPVPRIPGGKPCGRVLEVRWNDRAPEFRIFHLAKVAVLLSCWPFTIEEAESKCRRMDPKRDESVSKHSNGDEPSKSMPILHHRLNGSNNDAGLMSPGQRRQFGLGFKENLKTFRLEGLPCGQGKGEHAGESTHIDARLGGSGIQGWLQLNPILDANAILSEVLQRPILVDLERPREVVRMAQGPPILEFRPEGGRDDQALGPDSVEFAVFHDVHADLQVVDGLATRGGLLLKVRVPGANGIAFGVLSPELRGR